MSVKFEFRGVDEPFEADWPVTISEPVEGGKTQESVLVVRFRQLTLQQSDAVINEHGTSAMLELPKLYFIGLGKDAGRPFTPELRDKLLGLPHVRKAVAEAYSRFTNGVAEKNVETPPA